MSLPLKLDLFAPGIYRQRKKKSLSLHSPRKLSECDQRSVNASVPSIVGIF